MEFNSNILCRLQIARTDVEEQEIGLRLSYEKKNYIENVKKNIFDHTLNTAGTCDNLSNYRFTKRHL